MDSQFENIALGGQLYFPVQYEKTSKARSRNVDKLKYSEKPTVSELLSQASVVLRSVSEYST